jgi:hypothetical protein
MENNSSAACGPSRIGGQEYAGLYLVRIVLRYYALANTFRC